ncbi:MAG: hypothetical protein A2Y62_12525 [Candidatus Fischerbacteria bacterium RBG_13_37_8]|uniref:DUF1877 domain-containing protein n=1 Tax=Candidatus Fischerbacteria bacterium RBG_13_37_8 TaxID=1817863 RepID=A0A1F5VTK6_9BACT|nr:MAG: hypothetical protein A2Y62_12525 [Candidatus Fischerbacteria bacterium RBG_13_37_8]
MGIVANLQQVNPELLKKIIEDPSLIKFIVFHQEKEEGVVQNKDGNFEIDLGAKHLDWDSVNKHIQNLQGNLTFKDGTKCKVSQVSLSSKSTTWYLPGLDSQQTRATYDIREIHFPPPAKLRLQRLKKNALRWLKFGIIGGLVIYLLLEMVVANIALFGFVIFFSIFFIIGLIYSLVKGSLTITFIGSQGKIPRNEILEGLNLDKTWHALHYLLSGNSEADETPLGKLIMGGKEIGEDLGYGPAHYLTSDEVKKCSDALQKISSNEIKHRFDPNTLQKADIYPNIWNEELTKEHLDYLLEYFDALKKYYKEAASQQNAMLIYFD